MPKRLTTFAPLFVISIFLLTLTAKAFFPPFALSVINHIVISEVQIAGGTPTDEFIELYNPTGSSVNLADWKIYKTTASPGAEETLITSLTESIPANGFYLIAHTGFDGGVIPDAAYDGQSVSANNSVVLRNSTGDLIDVLGLGTSATNETTPIANPIDDRSVERKALSDSTEEIMGIGGVHELFGNGEDTGNNSLDFVKHVSPNVSNPQNKTSSTETPSVTETATVAPSIEATPTDEVTPTLTPTAEPTPTQEPSPTNTPSATPTEEPTPTTILTPTVSPSPSPESKVLTSYSFFGETLQCIQTSNTLKIGWFTLKIPQVRCFQKLTPPQDETPPTL